MWDCHVAQTMTMVVRRRLVLAIVALSTSSALVAPLQALASRSALARSPHVAGLADAAPPTAEISWLRNGTRLGYAVHAELGVVPESTDATGTPLPEVLVVMDAERFPSMSRARKACRRGTVLVNGAEGRCITRARAGDRLALQARVAPGFTPRGRAPFPVEVLFEDDSLAVVLKPAGVCTHPPPGGAPGGSMRTAVMHALQPPPVGTTGALYRPHCVHRLDRPTSGLLLCAKTKPSLMALSQAFRERTVRKRYEAIVSGEVMGDDGLIDSPIDGRSAQTAWRVLRRVRSLRLGGGHVTHLSLSPRTGRTHQLRIHCAEVLGCAIVGDKTYGGECVGNGLFLAALELTLDHPDRPPGAPPLHVSSTAPRKFGELLTREDDRWTRLGSEPADQPTSDGSDEITVS